MQNRIVKSEYQWKIYKDLSEHDSDNNLKSRYVGNLIQYSYAENSLEPITQVLIQTYSYEDVRQLIKALHNLRNFENPRFVTKSCNEDQTCYDIYLDNDRIGFFEYDHSNGYEEAISFNLLYHYLLTAIQSVRKFDFSRNPRES